LYLVGSLSFKQTKDVGKSMLGVWEFGGIPIEFDID
jgi:hypothetical protein